MRLEAGRSTKHVNMALWTSGCGFEGENEGQFDLDRINEKQDTYTEIKMQGLEEDFKNQTPENLNPFVPIKDDIKFKKISENSIYKSQRSQNRQMSEKMSEISDSEIKVGVTNPR